MKERPTCKYTCGQPHKPGKFGNWLRWFNKLWFVNWYIDNFTYLPKKHFENTAQLNLHFNALSNIFILLFFMLKHLFDILTFLTCLYNFLSLTTITFPIIFLRCLIDHGRLYRWTENSFPFWPARGLSCRVKIALTVIMKKTLARFFSNFDIRGRS